MPKRHITKAIIRGNVDCLRNIIGKTTNPSEVLPIDSVAIAASWGHKDILDFLLDAGKDVEVPGPLGPPLRCASLVGDQAMVRRLIEAGADINANGSHRNALHAAAMRGNTHVVRYLIHSGAKINLKGDFYGTALQAAAARRHKDVVEVLLDSGADVYAEGHAKDAFHAASEGGSHDVVMLLMHRGYTPRSAVLTLHSYPPPDAPALTGPDRIAYQNTSLDAHDILQAATGVPCLPRLSSPGSYKPRVERWSEYSSSPLSLEAAATYGHAQVVRSILQNNKTLRFSERDRAPINRALHKAIGRGHSDVVHAILESPLSIGQPTENSLVSAMAAGDPSTIEAVLQYLPVQKVTQKALISSLRHACLQSHIVVSRFLALRDELHCEMDLQPLLPGMLKTAARAGNAETVDFVLRTWQARNKDDLHFALKAACSAHNSEIVPLVYKALNSALITPTLISDCVLYAAASRRKDVLAACLVIFGQALKDELWSSAIWQAALYGEVENLNLLLLCDPTNNETIRESVCTQAVVLACLLNHRAVCELLLSAGADLNRVVQVPLLGIGRHQRDDLYAMPWTSTRQWFEEDNRSEGAVAPRLIIVRQRMRLHDIEESCPRELNALQACLEGFPRVQLTRYRGSYGEYRKVGGESGEQRASREETLRCLVDHGADMSYLGGGINYPLCNAAGVCSADCISWMVEKGANVNIHTDLGTVLETAVDRDIESIAIVRTLADAGADGLADSQYLQRLINIVLEYFSTTLPHADTCRRYITEGPGAVVQFLLRKDKTIQAKA